MGEERNKEAVCGVWPGLCRSSQPVHCPRPTPTPPLPDNTKLWERPAHLCSASLSWKDLAFMLSSSYHPIAPVHSKSIQNHQFPFSHLPLCPHPILVKPVSPLY